MRRIIFQDLSNEKQDELRREYRETYPDNYKYSIRLYILYIILGIITLAGLFVAIKVDLMVGSLLFVTGFIFMGMVIYFLCRSNNPFYIFLNRKGYVYSKKRY